MDTLIAIKNRYWVLILCALLFLTSYYIRIVLRTPLLEMEGRSIKFAEFFIFNYCLRLAIMLLFLLTYFLLLKWISFFWQDLENKKTLKVLLISYCVFFIPDILAGFYFTFLDFDYQLSDISAFQSSFYLVSSRIATDDSVHRSRSAIGLMDFAFFVAIGVGLQTIFEHLSWKKILPMVLILAAIYFGFQMTFGFSIT